LKMINLLYEHVSDG